MLGAYKSVFRKCGTAAVAFLLTAGTFGFYGMEFSHRAIVYFVVSYAVFGLLERGQTIRNRSVLTASAVYALFLTLSFVVGHQVSQETMPYFPDLTYLDWAYLIPYGGFLFVCVLNLMDWILSKEVVFRVPQGTPTRKIWGKWFLVLLLLWLPYFLIFYPANLSLDSFECVQQAIGDVPYGNNHPAAFVAMIAGCMKLGMLVGDINFGIACYSAFQILLFAAILSHILYWLVKKGAPNWAVWLCGAYYGLNPMIGTYAMTIWKDVLFGAFLLLMATWLYDVAQSRGENLGKPGELAKFALIAVAVSLLRNGMAPVACGLSIVLLLCYPKKARYFLPVSLAVLCVIFIILEPVYSTLNIPKANAAESYGVALQQIGYTLHCGGVIDPESRAFLNQILPTQIWQEVYSPWGSDSVKFHGAFDHVFFNANTGTFLEVWLKLLPANLTYYTKAWLMNTIGYYHVGTIETAYWYGIIPVERASELGIFRTDLLQAVTGTRIVARAVEAFLFYAKKLPVFCTVYSIAANVWVFVLGLVIRLLRKNQVREYLWGMLPLMALWLVIMATTPASCEFRYLFAIHLAMPVVLVFLFQSDEEAGKMQGSLH